MQCLYFRAALMVSQLLPVVHKGDTYQQLEWILLDAHSLLLEHLLNTQSSNIDLIASRCQRLSALIKHSTIPQNNDILALQQKVHFIEYNITLGSIEIMICF